MADTVLVTGGSGYIGGWCVAALLDRGDTVRATVRDLKRETAVRAAIATVAPAAADPARLSFHAASLEGDAGWSDAVAGCRYVLHVASPIPIAQPKDAQELIGPARAGALRVLAAALDAGVERVVMTSSVAAVGEAGAAAVADEREWTDLTHKGVTPYAQSKTIAERAARDFMAERGAADRLVTVNPALVLGPLMSRDFSPSLELPARLLKGQMPGLPNIGFNLVDVRDLADLHLIAMTAPQAAGGRYIAAGEFMWTREVAALLRAKLGEKAAKVPTRRLPDWLVRTVALFDPAIATIAGGLSRRREFTSAHAIQDLGWRPRPAEATVLDTAHSLFAHGVA